MIMHVSIFFHLKLIKSTPSRPILVPLPRANIYHRLKVHLLVHQSFGDLCCLLEMDIIYRKDSAFTTWLNIEAQVSIKADRVHLRKALLCYLVRCWETGLPHAQKAKATVFVQNDWTYHLLCREPIDSLLFWSSLLCPSPWNSV